jgi:hypothetical protein
MPECLQDPEIEELKHGFFDDEKKFSKSKKVRKLYFALFEGKISLFFMSDHAKNTNFLTRMWWRRQKFKIFHGS